MQQILFKDKIKLLQFFQCIILNSILLHVTYIFLHHINLCVEIHLFKILPELTSEIFCEIKTDLQFFKVLFLDAVDAYPVSNFHIFGRLFKVFLACPHLLHICNPFINLSPPQVHYYGVSDVISVIFAVLLCSPMLSIYAHGRMGMYQNGTISQIINFWSWKKQSSLIMVALTEMVSLF